MGGRFVGGGLGFAGGVDLDGSKGELFGAVNADAADGALQDVAHEKSIFALEAGDQAFGEEGDLLGCERTRNLRGLGLDRFQLGEQIGFFGFEGVEFDIESFAVLAATFSDGIGDVADGGTDFSETCFQVLCDGSTLGDKIRLAFAIFFEERCQVIWVIEESGQAVDDFTLEGFRRDWLQVAGAGAFGVGAGVAMVIGAVALLG